MNIAFAACAWHAYERAGAGMNGAGVGQVKQSEDESEPLCVEFLKRFNLLRLKL